jgi:hypothetical protein
MNAEASTPASFKQKAIHEGQEFAGIAIYLAFFFCAVVAYSSILLNQFHVSYFKYGTALINALIIAKVILIGEYAHLGKRRETRPLVESALYKALMFSLLVLAFHIVEEAIKALLHGRALVSIFQEINYSELLSRCLIVFCTFVPLFAFRELARVLGEDEFRTLFFRSGKTGQPKATGNTRIAD